MMQFRLQHKRVIPPQTNTEATIGEIMTETLQRSESDINKKLSKLDTFAETRITEAASEFDYTPAEYLKGQFEMVALFYLGYRTNLLSARAHESGRDITSGVASVLITD